MTYKVSRLYYLAEKYYKSDVEEEELLLINMTEEFWKEIDHSLGKGERVFMEIHGPTRSAKSTVAIACGQKMYQLMKKHPRYTIHKPFGTNNIARDQSERIKKIMDPKTNHTVIITDEDNELEKTGANSTSQDALGKTMSDIHAGRYIHEIMISPRDFLDPNTQIILNTIPGGMNKEKRTVFCKLYFRFWEGVLDHTQLIGHVEINVGKLIHEWIEEGQEAFFYPKPDVKNYDNYEDKKYIRECNKHNRIKERLQEICKKDFYTSYQVKKYEKMDMLTKEGIFRPRMLEISEVVLQVYEELKVLADTKALNKDMVQNFIKMRMRQAGIVNSILGEDLATREAMAVLNTIKSIRSLEKESKKNPEEKSLLMTKVTILKEALDMQLEELNTCRKINKQYNKNE